MKLAKISKLFILSTLCSIILSPLCLAQTIKMPEKVEVPVGRLAKIKIESDGDETKYFLSEGLDGFREYSNDPKDIRLVVVGYANKTYEVNAYTAKAEIVLDNEGKPVLVDGKPKIRVLLGDAVKCKVVVGKPDDEEDDNVDPVNPDKPEPTFPDGQFKLAKLAYDSTKLVKLDKKEKKSQTAKLIQAYKLVNARIAAGTLNNSEQILLFVQESTKTHLDGNTQVWKDWGTAIQEATYNLYKSGKLNTKEQWKTAHEEIIKGLEAI